MVVAQFKVPWLFIIFVPVKNMELVPAKFKVPPFRMVRSPLPARSPELYRKFPPEFTKIKVEGF